MQAVWRVCLALWLGMAMSSVTTCGGRMVIGVKMRLDAGPTAPLGGTMTLRATVVSEADEPNTVVSFRIPPGILVTSGEITHTTQLKRDTPQTFEVQVQLNQVGEHAISAGVEVYDQGGGMRGDADFFYLEVTPTRSRVYKESRLPTPTPHPDHAIITIETFPLPGMANPTPTE